VKEIFHIYILHNILLLLPLQQPNGRKKFSLIGIYGKQKKALYVLHVYIPLSNQVIMYLIINFFFHHLFNKNIRNTKFMGLFITMCFFCLCDANKKHDEDQLRREKCCSWKMKSSRVILNFFLANTSFQSYLVQFAYDLHGK
jgi:hypothetical protein